MEQNYYYDQGTIYEFDSLACKEAIKDYLKRNNKTRLGFDEEMCAYFNYEGISMRQVGEIRKYCETGQWSGDGKRKASDLTMLSYLKNFGLFFGDEMLFLNPVFSIETLHNK